MQSYAAAASAPQTGSREPIDRKGPGMKVLMWIVLIIFLIDLAVVLGLGSLIF